MVTKLREVEKENLRKKVLLFLTAIFILVALFLGKYFEANNMLNQINDSYSYLNIEETADENLFAVHSDTSTVAYVSLGRARGFGGEVKLAILVDSLGQIEELNILHQSETHSFFEKVINQNYLKEYQTISISELDKGQIIPDVITGATYTCRGIEDAIVDAAQNLEDVFHFQLKNNQTNKFRFGFPEIALILLYTLGFYLNYRTLKNMKWIKWLSALISIVFIGFIGQKMLTLANIGSYIMGDWPNIYDYLFWYILIAGVFLGLFLKNKNYYCQWVCPFGKVQEVLAAIGKPTNPKAPIKKYLHRGQQVVTLIAIILGLVYRNPSKTSYEIFSGLFAFTGSDFLFVSLGIVIILSLFIKNPWCNYLCPVKPSINYLREVKKMFSRKG